MKKLIVLLLFLLSSSSALAVSRLEGAGIRLSRNAPGVSPVKILVTASTNTMVTENGVRVIVGQGWQVSGNINVSINDLPAGVTPWPGVGNATAVNGRIIDFPGADLSPAINYGFYITSGIGNNPEMGLAPSYYRWKISTLINGGEDSALEEHVPVVSNDQITITGKTPPKVTDFQVELTSNNDGSIKQDRYVDYQVKYGSNLPYDTNKSFTLSVEWTKGATGDAGMPEVDLVEYVLGSATTGYEGAMPVIDPINRQISWTINGMPARLNNQVVGFTLKTNSNYKNSGKVYFKVKARNVYQGVSTVDRELLHVYEYVPPKDEGNNTPDSPTPTFSPTLTPAVTLLRSDVAESVAVKTVDQSNVKMVVGLKDKKAVLKVKFGKDIGDLDKEINIIGDNGLAALDLTGLEPATTYYFKVGSSGELYSFKTADVSDKPQVDLGSVIATSQNNIIMSSSSSSVDNTIVVTQNQDYSIRVALKKSETVKQVEAYVRDAQVLGVTTNNKNSLNYGYTQLVESEPGIYVGYLVSPKEEGYREIYLRISDYNGNIVEQKIGNLRSVAPLKIYSEKNKQPIENAKVTIMMLNRRTKIYEMILEGAMPIKNPSYSESDGSVKLSLPKGDYRLKVEAVGYNEKETDFAIGNGDEQKYPMVYLTRSPFSVTNVSRYYTETVRDVGVLTNEYVANLSGSARFFYAVVTLIVATLVGLNLMSFSLKLKIPVWLLPEYGFYHLSKIWDRKKISKYVEGVVVDSDNKWPVQRAEVYLIDATENKIVSKIFTDRLGNFHLKLSSAEDYKLAVIKPGFEATSLMEFRKEALVLGDIVLEMKKNEEMIVKKSIRWFALNLLEMFFEALMVLTIFFEIMFVNNFGLLKTLPFLTVSIVNLVLWLIYVYKMMKNKNRL